MIAQSIKTMVVAFIMSFFTIYALIGRLFVDVPDRRRFYVNHVHKHCNSVLKIMGVETIVEGLENLKTDKNYFIVCNHMSYLDALIMAAIRPLCFVTSIEMKETPGLGLLTEVGGCLYVERRTRENIHGEIGQITKALNDGFDVVVFPEATSSNGSKILPFKRALLAGAVQAEKPILPMVLQYEEIDGKKVDSTNRDSLCWYGDMEFTPHFVAMMKHKKIRIRVSILPEIPVTKESTRDILVVQAQEAIVQKYKPII